MQQQDKNGSVQLSTRYQQYTFAKGHLRGTSRPEVFPIGEEPKEDNSRIGRDISYCIDSNYAKGTNTIKNGRRQIVRVKEATKKGFAEATEGDSINLSVPNSKTRRGRVGKGVAQTIDTGMQQHTLQDAKIRRLTPKECERLQGFPDDWTRWGIDSTGYIINISDTQRYKMAGNAVSRPVITAIVKRLSNPTNVDIKE
jgi:DNA (cytosine-5)-methyltransferase 1